MPQLDIYTYLSQTSWTFLLFILYYINMKQIIIPSLLEIIKLKKNTIQLSKNNLLTNNNNKFINKYINI